MEWLRVILRSQKDKTDSPKPGKPIGLEPVPKLSEGWGVNPLSEKRGILATPSRDGIRVNPRRSPTHWPQPMAFSLEEVGPAPSAAHRSPSA